MVLRLPRGARVLFIAGLLLASALACARAQGLTSAPSALEGGLHTIESAGETREYLVHLPPRLGATPVPVILNFHGFGSNAAEQETLSGMSALADEAGFIVVYPQGMGDPPAWRVGPGEAYEKDAAFIADLLDALEREYPIDRRRVYATGISNGGGMVHRLGCEMADRFAAIAPVSGAYLLSEICSPSRPLPVLAFHGTGDRIVPYDGAGKALPPIPTWAARWADRDGCDGASRVFFDQDVVLGERWSDCDGQAEVLLYTIDGGGHTWPGALALPGADTIDASATMWDFFVAHPLP
jgi:polyhydroxybutyrate depolymerase